MHRGSWVEFGSSYSAFRRPRRRRWKMRWVILREKCKGGKCTSLEFLYVFVFLLYSLPEFFTQLLEKDFKSWAIMMQLLILLLWASFSPNHHSSFAYFNNRNWGIYPPASAIIHHSIYYSKGLEFLWWKIFKENKRKWAFKIRLGAEKERRWMSK